MGCAPRAGAIALGRRSFALPPGARTEGRAGVTFEWPYMLLLAAFPVGLLWLSVKRGRGEVGPSLGLPHIRRGLVEGSRVTFGNGSPEMRRYRWRFWASLLLVIFALGRPQWGPAEDVAFT